MIRTLAVTLLAILLIVVFQSAIKGGLLEARNAVALARVDAPAEQKAQLRRAISRIAAGYRQGRFTEVERSTLKEQLATLRSHAGEELSGPEADALLRRIETILERYQL